MSTRFVKFAPENGDRAETLAAYLDVQLATIDEVLVSWAARDENTNALRQDTNNNWVVAWPYDGPFLYANAIIPKPAEVDPYMEFAVIVDSPDWNENV